MPVCRPLAARSNADIARVPNVTIKAKFCAQERGAQLRVPRPRSCESRTGFLNLDQGAICVPSNALARGSNVVELICAFEASERRHRNKISAGHIVGFTVIFADVRAS